MKKITSLGFIVAALIVAASLWRLHVRLAFAKPDGTLHTENNNVLQDQINTFMEDQVTKATVWRQGSENYHCSNNLYGFDDQHAYAWIVCSGFDGTTADTLTLATGFSLPARFTYEEPDFQITAVTEASDGVGYEPSIRKLFPKTFYAQVMASPSEEELTSLSEETKTKALEQLISSAEPSTK